MKEGKRKRVVLITAFFLVLLFVSGGLLGLVSAEEQESQRTLKKRIAVSGFENKVRPWWSWRWEIGRGMEEMLVTTLVDTGKFTVLERQALDDILKEQELASEGKVSTQTAAQAGRLLGAQILIRGAITEFSHEESGQAGGIKIEGFTIGATKQIAHVAIDLRVYDTTSGEITASENVEGKAETTSLSVGVTYQNIAIGGSGFNKTPLGEATRKVIDQAVEIIVNEMKNIPWEGSVVIVKGEQVYINAGVNDNVKEGDIFVVYEKGEELIDPQTGLSLGAEEEELGVIEVISVKEKYSIAQSLKGSGFSRGDIIRERM